MRALAAVVVVVLDSAPYSSSGTGVSLNWEIRQAEQLSIFNQDMQDLICNGKTQDLCWQPLAEPSKVLVPPRLPSYLSLSWSQEFR